MLSVASKLIMLSVILLDVFMVIVTAPKRKFSIVYYITLNSNYEVQREYKNLEKNVEGKARN
jgi:hypothetical protein